MARQTSKLIIELEVVYVPMPIEHVEVWRAGVSLLLQIIQSESLNCDLWPRSEVVVVNDAEMQISAPASELME